MEKGPHDGDRFAIAVGILSIIVSTYNLGIIGVVLKPLEMYWHLSLAEIDYLGLSTIGGAALGAFFNGILADRFGRLGILLVDLLSFLFAGVASFFVQSYPLLLMLRFTVGVGVGIDYVIVFTYLSEIWIGRGEKVARYRGLANVMLFANFGILIAYLAGGLIFPGSPDGWRYVFLSGAAISLLPILLRFFLKESPAWRSSHHTRIRSILSEASSRLNRRRIARHAAPWFLYQISDQGLTVFLPLTIAGLLGITASQSDLGSVLIKSVTIPAALVAVLVIDRVGPRFLQIFGFLMRGIFLLALGSLFLLSVEANSVLSFTLLSLAYFFGALGPDKTTVILPAGTLPTRIRATGQGISESAGRMGGLVGVAGFGWFVLISGYAGGLLFFAMTCIAGFAFSFFYTLS